MRMNLWLAHLAVLGAFATPLFSSTVLADEALPDRPHRHTFSEAQDFSPDLTESIDDLLTAHQSETGAEWLIAVVKKNQADSLEALGQQLYRVWKVGQQGASSGLLILIDATSQQSAVITGWDQDLPISDREWKDWLQPVADQWAQDPEKAQAALTTALTSALSRVESPVVDLPVFTSLRPDKAETFSPEAISQSRWRIVAILFVVLVALTLFPLAYAILWRDTHYTGSGWSRVPGWSFFSRSSSRAVSADSHASPGGEIDDRW